MTKTGSRMALLALAAVTFLLQACAGTLTRQELDHIATMQVVRYKTPDLEVKTVTGAVLIFTGGILTAPLGASVDEQATKQASRGRVFPDFGELLMQDFVQRAPKEIAGWPKMTAVRKPVGQDYEFAGTVLVFDVQHIWLTVFGGLTIEGDVVLKNAGGSTALRRHFWYRSKDFGLLKEQEAYLADNCKLLIDEVPLAAKHTSQTLIIQPLKEGL